MARSTDIYFGRNILREALSAKARIAEIYYETASARKFAEGIHAVKMQKIPVKSGIPSEFKHQSHQGIAFRTSHTFYIPYTPTVVKRYPFVVLCNHVEDVHNFGSIARCAAGFGAKLVIHEEKNSAELTAAAMKSSAGLAFKLQFMKISNIGIALKDMSASGFNIVGLDTNKKAISIFDWLPSFPLGLVLGSEGSGIEPSVRDRCETLVKIPMEPAAESLNVSHAAAIAMNWAYKSETRLRVASK